MVIDPLQVEQLGKPRSHDCGVAIQIPRPGLVDQLIGDHIRVALESQRHSFPISCKFIQESTFVVPEVGECLVHCFSGVELSPGEFPTGLGRWQSCCLVPVGGVEGQRPREGVVNLFGDGPHRHPVPAEFLTEQVLVEFN